MKGWGIALVLVWAALGFAGCASMEARKAAREVVQAQKGGEATGAGATLVGPNNAAAPSTQVSETFTEYYPPAAASPIQPAPKDEQQPLKIEFPSAEIPTVAPAVVSPPGPPPPAIARTYQKSSTSLGQHQSAEGVLKVAAEIANSWKPSRIWGMLILAGGIAWAALSYRNEEGYMLCALGVAASGVACMVINGSAWWTLLAGLPLGFFVWQKLGLFPPVKS